MNKKILPIVGGALGVCILCSCISFALMGGSTNNKSDVNQNSSSSQEQTGSATNQNSEEQKQEEVIQVDINAFVKEFDDNQLAAEEKYKDKLIQTTGWVSNITEGLLGEKYVSIDPSNDEFYFGTSISCYPKDDKQLLTIKNGQSITIKGRVESQSLGIIMIKDCEIL